MEAVPLLAHSSAASVVAYRGGRPITAGQFMADAVSLAAILPRGGHMLNACADRYRFAVGLAAALITNKVSLLPPTYVPEVVRQLRAFAPDAFCLTVRRARSGCRSCATRRRRRRCPMPGRYPSFRATA
jgi:hypothetical protein